MEPTSTSQPGTPGWHPDPTARYEFRYFNGQRWTTDVAVDGVRYVDQTAVATGNGPAPAGPPAVAVVSHRAGAHPAPGNGKAILAFLFGLGSVLLGWTPFLFVVGAGLAIAAIVLGIQVLRRRPVVSKTRGFAIAGVSLAPIGLALCIVGFVLTGVTLREFEEYSSPGPRRVEITSCTNTGGMANMTGTVVNEDDRMRSYVVVVELLDGLETIETDSVAVDDVQPGSTAEWSVRQFVGQVELDCRIRKVNGPYPFDLDVGN